MIVYAAGVTHSEVEHVEAWAVDQRSHDFHGRARLRRRVPGLAAGDGTPSTRHASIRIPARRGLAR
jgi:hypothetical protein